MDDMIACTSSVLHVSWNACCDGMEDELGSQIMNNEGNKVKFDYFRWLEEMSEELISLYQGLKVEIRNIMDQ